MSSLHPAPPPKAILFDWDNTLVDNWPSIHAALNVTLTAMDHAPWTLAEAKLRVRESLRASFPRMFGDRWPEARDIFFGAFGATHLEALNVLDGATELLESLAATDIYLGVVSNKNGDLLRREADHLEWGQYFQRIVGAGDAAEDKPAAAPILLALSSGPVLPTRDVWFVGDAAIDMQCAHNSGCSGILVGTGAGEEEALAAFPPHLRISGHGDLAELVGKSVRPI